MLHFGAEVLWPEAESLYDLTCLRATIGTGAFAAEKQVRADVDATNLPVNGGSNTTTFAFRVFGQTITLTSNDSNHPFAFGPTALVIAPGDNLTIEGDPTQGLDRRLRRAHFLPRRRWDSKKRPDA